MRAPRLPADGKPVFPTPARRRPSASARFGALFGALLAALALALPGAHAARAADDPADAPALVAAAAAAPSAHPLTGAPSEAAHPGIATYARLAVYAPRGPAIARARWGETTRVLGTALPEMRVIMQPYDGDALERAVANGLADFVLAPAPVLARLSGRYPIETVAQSTAAVRENDPMAASGAAVIVANNDPALVVGDLQDRILWAAGDSDAEGLAGLRLMLRREGPAAERRFTEIRHTGYPVDAVVYQVRAMRGSVGVVPVCLVESMVREGLIGPNDVRVLGSSNEPPGRCRASGALFPGWALASAAFTPEAKRNALVDVLLKLPPGHPSLLAGSIAGWTLPPTGPASTQALGRLLVPEPTLTERVAAFISIRRTETGLIALGVLTFVILFALYTAFLQIRFSRTKRALIRTHSELEEKRNALEHAQRVMLVGELGTSLAHELNQPLESILNYSHGCRARAENIPEASSLVAPLGMVEKEVKRAADVVRRLRRLIRRDAPSRREASPSAVVDETVELMTAGLRRAGIDVKVERAAPAPAWKFDTVALQQILVNVLKNAMESIHGADPSVRPAHPSVRISETMNENLWTVRVEDNGPGFPEGSDPAIEPFFTTKANGLGLGLALCRQCAESLGGTFRIGRADAGTGVVAELRLPVGEAVHSREDPT